jgi:hypothetical protein
MNNRSDKSRRTSGSNTLANIKGIIVNLIEKMKEKDYTCPFCREVIKGMTAFGRHLKGHCT